MPSSKSRFKVFIIAPTPFYYQVPIFRRLASHPRIELTVYFCSDEALHAQDLMKEYKTDDRWGVEDKLLEGYQYKFLKNYSPTPSYLKWPAGLVNLGVWNEIKRHKPDVVVLMSWMNPTWWLAILACLRFKIPFLYMTDANVQSELAKAKWRLWPKKVFLGHLVFPRASGFLCSGTSNKLMYSYYNVPDEKLFPFAYSWGYDSFIEADLELRPQRERIRAELGIPLESFVVLFCGRLSKEKDPMHLLQAFHHVAIPNKALVLVGDGDMRQSMQNYVAEHRLSTVFFFGFQGRRDISKFYAVADVLVLPSLKETWGIVVNEALCFGLPIVCSDMVGASTDLVLNGYNGYIFRAGDVDGLANSIKLVAAAPLAERRTMGARSRGLIQDWIQRDPGESMVKQLDNIYPRSVVT